MFADVTLYKCCVCANAQVVMAGDVPPNACGDCGLPMVEQACTSCGIPLEVRQRMHFMGGRTLDTVAFCTRCGTQVLTPTEPQMRTKPEVPPETLPPYHSYLEMLRLLGDPGAPPRMIEIPMFDLDELDPDEDEEDRD